MNYLEEQFDEPAPRKRVGDPKNAYEYCKMFSIITKRPIGVFLAGTKGWPFSWFIEVQSLCKEKTREQQAKTINWYVREATAKVDKSS